MVTGKGTAHPTNEPRPPLQCQVLSGSGVLKSTHCVEINTVFQGAAEYQSGALAGLSGKLSNMSLNSSHGLALFLALEHPGR